MDPLGIIIFIVILLFSVIFHEVAHGLVADRLGDPTARYAGRLTLNPIPHIDPLWSILLPGLMLYLSGGTFVFGAAKPVPVDFRNFRNLKQGMFLVAIAGPLTNLVLAALCALVYRFAPELSTIAKELLVTTSQLNIVLAVFNMLPVPPLDGSKVFASILGFFNREFIYKFFEFERFGFIFLVILITTGIAQSILIPPLIFLLTFFFGGIPPELFTQGYGV